MRCRLARETLWFVRGRSRYVCIINRVHGTRYENIFMTRTVCRTIALFWSLQSDKRVKRYEDLKNDQDKNMRAPCRDHTLAQAAPHGSRQKGKHGCVGDAHSFREITRAPNRQTQTTDPAPPRWSWRNQRVALPHDKKAAGCDSNRPPVSRG